MISEGVGAEFAVKPGTRAVVGATPQGILLKPVTSWAIARARGLLQHPAGGKSFATEWAEHQREERELEEG